METPARYTFSPDGSTNVFPVPVEMKGDNYVRIDINNTTVNDRNKFDIVNNSIVFVSTIDVPAGSQLDVLVVQTDEGIANLGNVNSMDIIAQNIASVNAVASNTAAINANAANIAAIQNANQHATDAVTSAVQAAQSEVAASLSETNAANSAAAAASSEAQAVDSAAASQNSATASSNSAAAAASAEAVAVASSTDAILAEAAAIQASADATTAKNAAAASAVDSANTAIASANQATDAANSASTASTRAAEALSSKNSAAASEANAVTAAANAATSETNAVSAAAAASNSQIAAAASAASAASVYDSFDDRYLGLKSGEPTLDNDGDALAIGALYFDNTANEMRVYDGTRWIAASSAGDASMLNFNFTATASQTTFSGVDDNAVLLTYKVSNLIVTLNGSVLEDGTDYTATDGTTIVLASAATLGDALNVIVFKSFTTADMVPASTGGTFNGNVTAPAFIGDGSQLTGIVSIPSGLISLWSGSTATIPSGWAICDGNNNTPDLRDRFVVGAGSSYAVGDIGGANTVTLSTAQMPSHTHGDGTLGGTANSAGNHNHTGNTSTTGNHSHSGSTNTTGAHSHTYSRTGSSYGSTRSPWDHPDVGWSTQNTSSAGNHSHTLSTNTTGNHYHSFTTSTKGAHTHSLSITGSTAAAGSGSAHENRPPYYALAYIMKL